MMESTGRPLRAVHWGGTMHLGWWWGTDPYPSKEGGLSKQEDAQSPLISGS